MRRPGQHPKTLFLGALLALAMAPVLPALPAIATRPAAGESPVRIQLDEALALAERQNPELAAAEAQAAAAEEGATTARRATWPRLGLSFGWSRTDVPSAAFAHKLDAGEFGAGDFAISRLNDPAAVAYLGTALAVEAPLDPWGKVKAGAESAAARAKAAGSMVGEGRLDLKLQVIQAYRRAALAKRALAATEQALLGAKGREADVEARFEGGAALGADRLRARARRREREADLAERQGDAQAAMAALARALGAPAGTLYEPTDDPPTPAPVSGDLADWTAKALSSRPALAAAGAQAEAARWTARGGKKAPLPDLALWGQVQDDRLNLSGGKRSGSVGLTLRWSAFDPSRQSRQAAEAHELTAAEARARAAADQVRLEVETAWHRAQAARQRFAAAAGGAEEGREALRVVRERRQAGIATLTDELETEAASLAAELSELSAAAEVALADAALARAAGDPGAPAAISPPNPARGETK